MKNLSIAIGFVLSLSTMAFFAHRNHQQQIQDEQEKRQLQVITRSAIHISNTDTVKYRKLDTLTIIKIKEDSLGKKQGLVRANL